MSSIVTTLEHPCRSLAGAISPNENASRFLVGTLNPKGQNLLYVFEYKDDNNNLARISYKFPYGEVWHLSTPNKFSNLVSCVIGNRDKRSVALFKLPRELEDSIDDDHGLSDSPIEQLYIPISEGKNLACQSLWHPDDGNQLLTFNDGILEFWDVTEQTRAISFSLTNAANKALDSEQSILEPKNVSDLRWSSLFNCSVAAVAIGSKIYGIDTRIDDSSPASVCWLIQDHRCNRVRSVDFNPNSQYYVASGGDDCRTNFWDLRQTSHPVLHIQAQTHWIWSVRYNLFHDQLVLSASSDSRVALIRAQSIASEPYGQLTDDDIENIGDGDTDKVRLKDEVVKLYEEHDDSVYAAEWATDPWIFASLGFDSRLVINKVPKAEKFRILF